MLKRPLNPRHSSRGTSLLESLVALLILALGVLGLTRAHVSSLLESRHTTSRSVAVSMAADMLERMRTNPSPVGANPYAAYTTAFGALASPQKNCRTTTCESGELATSDLWAWKSLLAAELPDGDGAVFVSTEDPTQFAVLIAWNVAVGSFSGQAPSASDQLLNADATAVWRDPATQGTGIDGADCPASRICHLVFIRP